MTDDELQRAREQLRAMPEPAPEDARQPFEIVLDMNLQRALPGSAVLDAPQMVESVWGDGHRCLWPKGEPFILCGPDGVGKTTLVQQLALKQAGIGESSLLGLAVHAEERRVLYLACDRPAQAMRSFARMVTEGDRQLLDERLVIWKGPLPFDLANEPPALLALVQRLGCSVVVLDSIKDVAADLSREETGLGLNRAFQVCVASGVDVCGLHHQRKAQSGGGKPRHLADVYGSRWLTAGAGSVVMLWGDAGDPVVDLEHLKQPDEPVGPFQVLHDHVAGVTSVLDHVDAYTLVLQSRDGIAAGELATKLYGEDGHNSTQKARRQLERLVREQRIHRREGARGGSGGSDPARYYPLALVRQGGLDDEG